MDLQLIVLMMLDDFGRERISASATPNLWRMLERGTSFTCAYSMALCVPSRATLMTGMYPFDTGWNGHWGHWFHAVSPTLVDSGYPLWPTFLPAGWRKVATGKWHVGDAASLNESDPVEYELVGAQDGKSSDGTAASAIAPAWSRLQGTTRTSWRSGERPPPLQKELPHAGEHETPNIAGPDDD